MSATEPARRWSRIFAVTAFVALTACSGAQDHETIARDIAPGTTGTVRFEQRTFRLHVPEGYVGGRGVPLVVLLHGYTSTSAEVDGFFHGSVEAERRRFLLMLPDGATDAAGDRFWDDTAHSPDSQFLGSAIAAVRDAYDIGRSSVFVLGHSNGGFMAHRLACDHADQVAAVVSVAGTAYEEDECEPARPVSVLQVHGDTDHTIRYGGGAIVSLGRYLSARDVVTRWRRLDGCSPGGVAGPALDLEPTLPGAETTVLAWHGCGEEAEVALWTIVGGEHVPARTPLFYDAVYDWLAGHARTG